MDIQIISTDKAQVVVNGKNVPSVDACICLFPDDNQIMSKLMPYLNNVKVSSNVESIISTSINDPNVELEILEADAFLAMKNKIVSLGYNVK